MKIKTVHIVLSDEEKTIIQKAATIQKLKPSVFVRRLALFESEKLIKEDQN